MQPVFWFAANSFFMKQLIFFTESFPFGKGESFIENEIAFLAKKFDRIYLLPKMADMAQQRDLPANCVALPPVFRNPLHLALKGIFCCSPIFCLVKWAVSDKVCASLYKLRKYLAAAITCRGILADRHFKKLNKLAPESTVYFYWGIGMAYILPFIQNTDKKIVRFHGTDLYLERRPHKYIPFRKEVFQNLTKAVFISRQGMEYAMETFGQYHFAAYLSYLGTLDHGMPDFSRSDSVIRILSCSYIVPVKRISRILQSLLLIKDCQVHWTHIGGGDGLKALQQSVQQLPANLSVDLLGDISNEEVIGYYCSHPVDVFVNVSLSEGLPVSIMEAISFGIPVVATDVGGTHEIVTPESGVLIDVDFANEELARQIVRVYENKSSFQSRKVWETKFDATKNYEQFVSEILS